jgi:hypothetical protein
MEGRGEKHRVRMTIERARALTAEVLVLQIGTRRRQLLAETEDRIVALSRRLHALDATLEAWDGRSPHATVLAARIDQIEAELSEVERRLRRLRRR